MSDDPMKLRADAAEASAALKMLEKEGAAAAGVLQDAFEEAGAAIADALEDAARSGEFSFNAMAEAVLQDLAALAIDRLFEGPVENWAAQLGKGLGAVLGQRAEGGPVLGGERYLVGERGPEVFTPSTSGAIQPASGPVIHLTINAGADAAESVRRSERQIAAIVARAASRGSQLL